MEFSRQEYWNGVPFPTPGDLSNSGVEPTLLCLLHWQVDSLPLVLPGKPKLPRSMYAAAAKSLQLCLTLCDPIDGSPPGSTAPGILQARTLECAAISFSKLYYELFFIFTFLLCPFLPIHFSNLAVGVRKLLGRTPTFTIPYIAGISLTEEFL